VKTREQAILAAIASIDGVEWKALESRAESLPAMLLRHGVLPVKLFLLSKTESDESLWELVERGIKAVLPGVVIDLDALSQMPFEQYLLLNEVAAEAAALVARWVKVHTATGGVTP
jgi:hypothetical protein